MKKSGGKVGWFPRGVLNPELERTAFTLEVRKSSDPVSIDEQTVVIVIISERAAAREIDEQSQQVLKANALQKWYEEEYTNHKVRIHGFKNGYDSENDAWVQWQLQRMKREQPTNSRTP